MSFNYVLRMNITIMVKLVSGWILGQSQMQKQNVWGSCNVAFENNSYIYYCIFFNWVWVMNVTVMI